MLHLLAEKGCSSVVDSFLATACCCQKLGSRTASADLIVQTVSDNSFDMFGASLLRFFRLIRLVRIVKLFRGLDDQCQIAKKTIISDFHVWTSLNRFRLWHGVVWNFYSRPPVLTCFNHSLDWSPQQTGNDETVNVFLPFKPFFVAKFQQTDKPQSVHFVSRCEIHERSSFDGERAHCRWEGVSMKTSNLEGLFCVWWFPLMLKEIEQILIIPFLFTFWWSQKP